MELENFSWQIDQPSIMNGLVGTLHRVNTLETWYDDETATITGQSSDLIQQMRKKLMILDRHYLQNMWLDIWLTLEMKQKLIDKL